jgi:hypothetical protein
MIIFFPQEIRHGDEHSQSMALPATAGQSARNPPNPVAKVTAE